MSEINNIKNAKEKLPYTFVPIKANANNSPISEAKFNRIKKDKENLYSGYFNCSMYALNYLLVGNEHKTIDQKTNNEHNEIYPLIIDDKIHISPYTIKGALSSFLAAFYNIKMKRINERKFTFRPNINLTKKNMQYVWAVGIVTNVTDKDVSFVKIDGLTKFFHTERHKFINLSKFNDEQITIVDIKTKNGKKEPKHYYCFEYQNGIDGKGYLVKEHLSHLSEEEKKKSKSKPHNVIGFPENKYTIALKNNKTLTADLTNFNKVIKFLKDYINNHNSLGNNEKKEILNPNNWDEISKFYIGDPIFFEYDTNNPDKIYTFGKTFYYPWVFDKGLNAEDFPEDIRKESDLTFIEEMFGYSYKDDNKNHSKSGKIHLNFATHVKGGEKIDNIILKRPGEPKPSSYEFYLQQNNNKYITSYQEPLSKVKGNIRLSGRKFYKTVIKDTYIFSKNIEKYSIVLKNVIKSNTENMAQFKFKVNFENLTEDEVKKLRFALVLDNKSFEEIKESIKEKKEFYCHQIGYAKNYGIGAIKIIIDNSKIFFFENNKLEEKNLTYFKIDHLINELTKNIDEMYNAFGVFYEKEFDYPGNNSDIIKWHSKIRQKYAKERRETKNHSPKKNNKFQEKDIKEKRASDKINPERQKLIDAGLILND